VYLNLSIKFSDAFGSTFDFGDMFGRVFYVCDVNGLQRTNKCCLILTLNLVTCLGERFFLVMFLVVRFTLVMCMDYK
jgi:hypothetical protein